MAYRYVNKNILKSAFSVTCLSVPYPKGKMGSYDEVVQFGAKKWIIVEKLADMYKCYTLILRLASILVT